MALGEGPRRAAFQEAIQATVNTQGRWKEMGDVVVPDASPVSHSIYWRTTGALLALTLIVGESPHPVSPAVIYALLSNVYPCVNARASMHLSLSFIRQLQGSVADALLPWMVIPQGQDLKSLPDGHRRILLQLVTNLNLDVSEIISIVCYWEAQTPFFSLVECHPNLWMNRLNGPPASSPLQCLETITSSNPHNSGICCKASRRALKLIDNGMR